VKQKERSPLDALHPASYLPVLIGGVPFVLGFVLVADGNSFVVGVPLIVAAPFVLVAGLFRAHNKFAANSKRWCFECKRRPRLALGLCGVCAANDERGTP
jgi:hypothetical protein